MTDSNRATTITELEHAALLNKLRANFPAFRIWREITGDRTVYIARRRQPTTRLHTLVTRDPHELHAALADNSPAARVPDRAGQERADIEVP